MSVEQHLRLQHVAPACSPSPVPGPGGSHYLAGGAGPLVGDRPHHLPGTQGTGLGLRDTGTAATAAENVRSKHNVELAFRTGSRGQRLDHSLELAIGHVL